MLAANRPAVSVGALNNGSLRAMPAILRHRLWPTFHPVAPFQPHRRPADPSRSIPIQDLADAARAGSRCAKFRQEHRHSHTFGQLAGDKPAAAELKTVGEFAPMRVYDTAVGNSDTGRSRFRAAGRPAYSPLLFVFFVTTA